MFLDNMNKEKCCVYHCKCMNLDKSCPNPHYLDDKCICPRPTSPKELPKGVCPSCWGKKFNSVMTRQVGHPDFPGDKGFDTGSYVENVPCSKCNGTGLFTSPKEEIVNDWESEIQKDLDDGKFYSICSNETTFKNYIYPILSSTEKRVAKDTENWAIEMKEKVDKDIYCKNESNDWKNGYDCAMYDLINLIKSKYE